MSTSERIQTMEQTRAMAARTLAVSLAEDATADQAGAFTIEPRPSVDGHAELPLVAFHTICVVDGGGQTASDEF